MKYPANSLHRVIKDFYAQSVANSKPFKLIDFEAPSLPVILNFQTRSSQMMAVQKYIYNEVEVQKSESIKKSRKLLHIVINTIIQNNCQRRSLERFPANGLSDASW